MAKTKMMQHSGRAGKIGKACAAVLLSTGMITACGGYYDSYQTAYDETGRPAVNHGPANYGPPPYGYYADPYYADPYYRYHYYDEPTYYDD